MVAVPAGATVTGVRSCSTTTPSGEVSSVVRTREVVVRPRLATVVATSRTAWSSSMRTVVMRTPSGTMCVGSSTCSRTGRWRPAPAYHRESWPARTSMRSVFVAPARRYGVRSTKNRAKPSERLPANSSLRYTIAWRKAPWTSRRTIRPAHAAGASNVFT